MGGAEAPAEVARESIQFGAVKPADTIPALDNR
jgi:hypothetical protein